MEILWPRKISESEVPLKPSRIALVNMPWSQVDTPSIQCGLLKSTLQSSGHEVDVHYLNLELAAELGIDKYESFSNMSSERVTLLGEWLFSRAAYGSEAGSAEQYIEEFPEIIDAANDLGIEEDKFILLREEFFPAWVDRVSRRPWGDYDLVGFSSTFMQNVASLALASGIKKNVSTIPIVFGGANFDGVMGMEFFRAHEFIDYAIIGEGEEVFPELVRRLAVGESAAGMSGVLARGAPSTQTRAPSITDLNQIPTPDYTDYFRAVDNHGASQLLRGRRIELLVEFSRGCWWGAKHHCTFCGLNALGMDYRAKSPDRAFAELETLLRKYKVSAIAAVDNIIDMKYVSDFCDKLSTSGWTLSLFFEVKANLQKSQVKSLADAGVAAIQPGIESLSSNVLKIMRKGSDALINIRLMKWARYYSVAVHWNILCGFPGETDEDYLRQAKMVPLLHHLEPPTGVNSIWIERFSPYFNGHSNQLENITPRRSYYHIYPESRVNVRDVAYFFDADVYNVASPASLAVLSDAVEKWRSLWRSGRQPTMFMRRGPGWLEIEDRRTHPARRITMVGWQAAAYDLCTDNFRNRSSLAKEIKEHTDAPSTEAVNNHIDQCRDEGLMIEDQERVLSLALPFHHSKSLY